MDRTTRYLFLLLGFIVFLIIAPLMVFYLSGTRFDFSNRDTEATGIIVAKSNPSGAKVYINDKETDQTEATIRFLNRAEYNVRLTKDGYFPWTKRLAVEQNKVTYTYEGLNAVELIRLPQPQTLSPTAVTSLVVTDNQIWFGNTGGVGVIAIDKPAEVATITLPFTPRSLQVMRNSDFLLAQNETGRKILINRSNRTAIPLPDTFVQATDINVSPNGMVLARRGDTLYGYDTSSRITSPLLHNIAGFTLLGSTGYVAFRSDQVTLQTVEWTGNSFTNAEPLVGNQLPNSSEVQLVITNSKVLFALSGGTLYRANSPLEVLSNQVRSIHLDLQTDELTFATASELWFYNFIVSKPQLLTRTADPVNTFQLRSSIGYGFIGTDSGLHALEIDDRDQQNRYTLLEGGPVWAVGLSNNEKILAALQNDRIIITPIR